MDCLTLKNLKFHGLHGYFPEERRQGNDFEVDVSIWVPLQEAAKGDELAETIDYSKAATIVKQIMEGEPVKLIETLLYNIGESLTRTWPRANKIEVVIRKLHPPMSPSCEFTEVKSQWPKL